MIKRKIMLTFATAFVFMFNFQFTFAEEAIVTREVIDSDVKPVQFQTVRTIEMKQTNPVKLDLPVKDKDIVVVIDNSEKEVPEEDNKTSPFSYALFAGGTNEDLLMYGDGFDIKGDCHSNGSIQGYTGATSSLEGEYSAYGNVNVSGNGINVPKSTDNERNVIMPMPDLSDMFDVNAKDKHSYFSNNLDSIGKRWIDYIYVGTDNYIRSDFGDNLKCSYSDALTEGELGTWELGGENLVLKQDLPLFFDGNVKFSLDNITGSGFIIARGDIVFNNGQSTDLGLKYKADGTVDLDNSAEIGFYSIGGNIQFNMAEGAKFKGLVYAPGSPDRPGSGYLQLNTNAFELYGSLVASKLELGGNKKIHYAKTDLHKKIDDEGSTDELHFLNAREAAKSLIDNLKTYTASNIDMATIIYSETAKVLKGEKVFYSVNKGEADKLKNIVDSDYDTNIGCNLGDGFRLGYHILKDGNVEDRNNDGNIDSDDKALDDAATEKYLIVFSYNLPNRYTMDGTSFRTDNIEVSTADGSDSVEALKYATEIAKTIKSEGFDKVYFVDINNSATINSLTAGVANEAGAKIFDPMSVAENGEVVNSILKDLTYVPVVKDIKVAFNTTTKPHKLPDDVEIVEDTEETVKKNNLKLNGDQLELIPGTYDILPSSDKTEATISDLYLNVKLNRITDSNEVTTDTTDTKKTIVDPIKFEETELIYTFIVTDKDGDDQELEVPVPVDELLVKVFWSIDIN